MMTSSRGSHTATSAGVDSGTARRVGGGPVGGGGAGSAPAAAAAKAATPFASTTSGVMPSG